MAGGGVCFSWMIDLCDGRLKQMVVVSGQGRSVAMALRMQTFVLHSSCLQPLPLMLC